jgi:phage terminase large subunit GpA-like protein
VPPGVLVLTAGVDIQKDRIECEVVGWGKDHESWSIDYKVFHGSPGVEMTIEEELDAAELEPLSDVWDELATFLMSSFAGVGSQAFRIQCVGVDSGYLSTTVYKFCKKYAAKRWFAVKGMSDPFKPLLSKPTALRPQSESSSFPDRNERGEGRHIRGAQGFEARARVLSFSRSAAVQRRRSHEAALLGANGHAHPRRPHLSRL